MAGPATPGGPVTEVIIGATDLAATVEFLALFELSPLDEVDIAGDEAEHVFVGGLADGPCIRLAAPAARDHATVLIVPTRLGGGTATGWQHGPRALDLYTSDLDRSMGLAAERGFAASPEALLQGGPMTMRQRLFTGPDQLPVVLVESTHRRSSVCDLPDPPLHSEPHSVVWCVGDHVAEVERWTAAGWTTGATINFSEPSVSDELSLPERPTPITMTMLSDESVAPVRMELLTFDDHVDTGAAATRPLPTDPIRAGIHALTLSVDSVEAAIATWGVGADFTATVAGRDDRPTVAGVTVGGVRLVLVGEQG